MKKFNILQIAFNVFVLNVLKKYKFSYKPIQTVDINCFKQIKKIVYKNNQNSFSQR